MLLAPQLPRSTASAHARPAPAHHHHRRSFEDITPAEAVRANPRCDRDVTLYGYVRGCAWKEGARVHIAGVGDYPVRPTGAAPR